MKVIIKISRAKVTRVLQSFKNFMIHYLKKKTLRHTMRRTGSKNRNLGTYKINKRSLSQFYDTQYILKNGVRTLAYGHKDK